MVKPLTKLHTMKRRFVSINFAYANSPQAVVHGYRATGCYTVEVHSENLMSGPSETLAAFADKLRALDYAKGLQLEPAYWMRKAWQESNRITWPVQFG